MSSQFTKVSNFGGLAFVSNGKCAQGRFSSTPDTSLRFTRSVSTTVTKGPNYPNYRLLLTTGQNACTVLTVDGYKRTKSRPVSAVFTPTCKSNCSNPAGSYTMTGVGYFGDTSACTLIPTGNPSGLSTYAAQQEALTELWKKIEKARSPAQLGEDLGEIRELVHLLRSPAKAFREGLNAYHATIKKWRHRTKRFSSREVDTFLADTWLSYAFGWKPLVNDVKSAAEALAERNIRLQHVPTTKIVRSHAVNSGVDAQYSNISAGGTGYCSFVSDLIYSHETQVHLKAAVRLEQASGFPGILGILGLNLDNFVPTLWELIPYSFVVDYFTNIGDLIYAVHTGTGSINWLNGTTVQKYVVEYPNITAGPASTYAGYTANCRGYVTTLQAGRYRTERVKIVRDPYYPISYPDFHFQVPGMGSLKWLNLTALARLKTL